ncbi:axin-like isoform X2 [Hyposmocoma kahamanoa]|uniref:axin-like isoform X2 n=1 Tax=Hyposmocoma kahamanoa TaxID=1477025 RepID=UPI000E6D720F|nr:axin-like isoform X2 [Hyposmocoma kahamanoa]
MSHTPVGGHPQGWEYKLADRSSLPPASGEEKSKSQSKHVFTQPHLPKMAWREETEGSSGGSPAASPPYMRWARSLHNLLEDAEGVRLFRKFVGGAGGLHVDRLNFYFAVQGLRQETEPSKIRQVVSAIYKFLRKSQLTMPEQLKAQVKQGLKDGAAIERTIFDNMEQEVTRDITETTYRAFLRSEAYVSYVSAATQPLSSPDASPPHAHRDFGVSASGGLATLHEGQELGATAAPTAPARLTHDALLATQSRRLHSDIAPDGMSVRGVRERERHRPRLPGMDKYAVINKEQDTGMVIPRTQRVSSEALRVLPPAEFAPLLIEKLERVKRDQDTKERLERRLQEGDGEEATQALPPQLVAAAIREKLQLDDDNDQDILDQHVSRVWSERTPGASPPGTRRARPRHAPHAPHAHRRAPSALSADSGHYDAPPDQLHHSHSLTRRSFSKKTVTELTDSGVSVVSEGTTSAGGVEPRILLWIAEGSERLERRGYRELSSRGSSVDRDDRRRDKQRQRGSGSKSSSTSGGGTTTVAGGASGDQQTVVVVSFLDEAVPYRFKVPASPLTLKTFKDYLPRKGNYRYFFKTECADLDNTVIQEEVSNDSDTLPMFEGKVMARVKSIE